MNETTRPLLLELPHATNIDSILRERLATEPESTIIERNTAASWTPVTVDQFNRTVMDVAKGFVALGVQPGDKIGIMSRTRFEWTVLDFAAWAAGAVPVPIYETSSASQVEWILSNSEISILVVENDANAATVASIRDRAPYCREVFTLDNDGLGALISHGTDVQDAEIDQRRQIATLDDLATIIYTSGTTGRPKGVELTHGNFMLTALNTVADIPEVFNGEARAMLFLPLAHVFARFVEVIAIAGGSVLGHSPDIRTLVPDLKAFKPTYVLAVPRVFEKIYNAAEQSSAAEKARPYFNWATRVAISYSRALDTPQGPSTWLKVQHMFADGFVYNKLRSNLGGKAKYAVSGGGPLGERLGHFYRGLGLNVMEGYGLTESTAPASVNKPDGRTRIGSVGELLPGHSAKISQDGEILLKGHNIFRGYHKNPTATAESFTEDGWFRTGDLGTIDDNGFLAITGRKKEIIVTAGGKNVAPAVLEDRVRAHALVSQCVVVGDNKPFIGAMITIDPEGLRGWLTMHNKSQMTVAEAMADEDVNASIARAIERANEAVSHAEAIKKHTILPGDFTIDNGYLTPSMKIKRTEVLRDFAADVEALYTPSADRARASVSA